MDTAADQNHEEAAVGSAAAPVRSADACKLKQSRQIRWNNDGPSEISSLSVLLDWLTTEENYARWRGGDNHSGETKAALASQIATLIESRGVTTGRKIKDIINKIGQLEQSFRQAVDFLSNTGAGITDETSLRVEREKRCPHYEARVTQKHLRNSRLLQACRYHQNRVILAWSTVARVKQTLITPYDGAVEYVVLLVLLVVAVVQLTQEALINLRRKSSVFSLIASALLIRVAS